MLRKLAIAIAASGAMMSASTTYALGMGEIELSSALSQPLEARIKLLKASELEDWEIKPDLASSEEFEKSGVERVFFLNDFEFEIERSDDGVFVHISSDQPVVEPFLNFLVQVDWPSGRLLREYTLLLDPPVFDEVPSEPVMPAETSNDDFVGMVEDEVEVEQEDFEASLPGGSDLISDIAEDDSETGMDLIDDESDNESPSSVASPAKPKTYVVRKDDTLWEVAIRVRENRSISPQQAMLAIQDLNPSAFINGNINRLKKNEVLRVPTESEMLARTFKQAVSEVSMQNQVVAKRKAQLDATRKESTIARDDKAADARLKLLAGGEATADTQRGAGGKVVERTAGDQSSLENDLNLALENLDKSKLENQELRSRLDSLEEQISTLQRLINLKDEQMVALQTGMSDTTKSLEDKDRKIKQIVDVDQVTPETELNADLNFSNEPDTAEGSAIKSANIAADTNPVTDEPKKDVVKPKPKPKFVYTPPEDDEEEPFDVVGFAIENPQIPGALLAVLLGLLYMAGKVRKRKQEAKEEAVDGSAFDGEDPLENVAGDIEGDFHGEFDDLDLGGDSSESDFPSTGFEGDDIAGDDFDTSALDEFSASDAGMTDSLDDTDLGEGQDVLGEVDVYMAYNRIEPARELLEKTLAQQPGRVELRVKLLEVLSEMDDGEAFNEQFDLISADGSADDKAHAESIKASYVSLAASDDMGLGLETSDDSFGLDLDSDELDFDLNGLDLASDLGEEKVTDVADDENSSLDFDMDLSSFESSESSSESDFEAPEADSGLEFSLDEGADESLSLDGGFDTEDNELLAMDSDSMDSDLESLDVGDVEFDLDSSLQLDEANAPDLTDSSALDIELDGGLNDSGFDSDLNDLSSELDDLSVDVELDGDLDSLDLDSELDLDTGLDADLAELDESLGDVELPETLAGEDLDFELDSDDIALDLDDDIEDLSADVDLSVDDGDLDLGGVDLDIDSEVDQKTDALDALVESDELAPLDDLDLDNLDEDLDFLSGTDESETKLDLARAYIDMDDKEGAREILQEVLEEGNEQQKGDASILMDKMA